MIYDKRPHADSEKPERVDLEMSDSICDPGVSGSRRKSLTPWQVGTRYLLGLLMSNGEEVTDARDGKDFVRMQPTPATSSIHR